MPILKRRCDAYRRLKSGDRRIRILTRGIARTHKKYKHLDALRKQYPRLSYANLKAMEKHILDQQSARKQLMRDEKILTRMSTSGVWPQRVKQLKKRIAQT